MRYGLFGFPRSGTTWLAQCLNALPGCAIADEPFYQPIDPMLIRSWPDALVLYQADRLDPQPPAPVTEHLAEMVADWLRRLAPATGGFKEVYAGWKIPTMIDGVCQADPDARAILLWRGFEGVLSSFERRDIMGWVTQVWERTRERSTGDGARLIEAIDPSDDVARLFATWLTQGYADCIDMSSLGSAGLVLRHRYLTDTDEAWERLAAHLGQTADQIPVRKRRVLRMPEQRRWVETVKSDTQLTRNRWGGYCDELRRRALSVADQTEHPDVVQVLLEV